MKLTIIAALLTLICLPFQDLNATTPLQITGRYTGPNKEGLLIYAGPEFGTYSYHLRINGAYVEGEDLKATTYTGEGGIPVGPITLTNDYGDTVTITVSLSTGRFSYAR